MKIWKMMILLFFISSIVLRKLSKKRKNNFQKLKEVLRLMKEVQCFAKNGIKAFSREESNILGSGSFGVVYKAFEIGNENKAVAIKEIKIADNPKAISDIESEIHMLEKMNIQNRAESEYVQRFLRVIKVFECEREQKKFKYIVTPRYEMDSYRMLNENVIFQYLVDHIQTEFFLIQLAERLQSLHKKNLIYNDLKSDNVMVDFIPNTSIIKDVVLIDFGLVEEVTEKTKLMTESRKGTVNFMSPEALNGLPHSFDTDVWSFGCFIFFIFDFETPFDSAKKEKVIEKINHYFDYLNHPGNKENPLNAIIKNVLEEYNDSGIEEPDKKIIMQNILYLSHIAKKYIFVKRESRLKMEELIPKLKFTKLAKDYQKYDSFEKEMIKQFKLNTNKQNRIASNFEIYESKHQNQNTPSTDITSLNLIPEVEK